MSRILLVRHGESEWNAAGRWQGWADPPLSPLGRVQAVHAARAVDAVEGVDTVLASDLRRAVETAELLARTLGLELVALEPALRERDVGDWSGLTRDEIEERWPDWRDRVTDPPGGEAAAVFEARVLDALRRVAETYRETTVLAVSHGGVIRTLERHLGIEPEPIPNLAGRWFAVDGSGISAAARVVLVDPEDIELTIPPPH